MSVEGSLCSPITWLVLRLLLDLVAGLLDVAAEAFHGVAGAEEERRAEDRCDDSFHDVRKWAQKVGIEPPS